MHRSSRILIALCAAMLPLAVQAHPGHETHAGFLQGVLHPLSGWDHLAVLLCLGVVAAGRGARIATLCGGLLVLALGGGAALGLNWHVDFVEPAIIATVAACLLLLAFRRRISAGAVLGLSMAFAAIHGIAHGQEAPGGDLAGYFAGFTLAGVALYAAGLLLASLRLPAQNGAPSTRRQPGKSPASR